MKHFLSLNTLTAFKINLPLSVNKVLHVWFYLQFIVVDVDKNHPILVEWQKTILLKIS